MSSHYLLVVCPACATAESIYTGDVELNHFDESDWEGEHIYAKCRKCKEAASHD